MGPGMTETATAPASGLPPSALAWCGWTMPIDSTWRPLRIDGEWSRGEMIVGDAMETLFQVTWRQPDRKRFAPLRWLDQRARELDATVGDPPPHAASLHAVRFFPEVPSPVRGSRAMWYGWAPDPGLMVEVAVNRDAEAFAGERVWRDILAHVTVAPADAAVPWSVFGVSFRTPPGFQLANRKLLPGDMSILVQDERRRLLVRQVYPAATALRRHPLEHWLSHFPFKEHRRYRRRDDPASWNVTLPHGTSCDGLHRTWRKTLGVPFHVMRPLTSVAAVVVDPDLHRLLVAESDAPAREAPLDLEPVMRDMNWAATPSGSPIRETSSHV